MSAAVTQPHTTSNRATLALRTAAAGGALLLAACGGGAGDDTATAGADDSGSTSSAPSTTAAPPEPFTMAFAGDTSFTDGMVDRDPLGAVTPLLSGADLAFVNLETAVAEDDVGTPYPKDFTFRSPPESVGLLTAAGIDGVSNANNHSLDYGKVALDRTLELLDEGGVAHFGGGKTPEDAYAPVFMEAGNRTVGLVGFSHVPCDWSAADPDARPGVAWMCPPFVDRTVEAVEAAAAEADVVVVMGHWGTERERCPDEYQHELARLWSEAGADIVVAGHHHVLQGIERIGDTWVVHGYGNFAFPSAKGEGADTAVFEFTVGADDTDIGLRLHPARISNGRPSPLTGSSATGVLDTVETYSFGVALDDEGNASPSDDEGACPAPPAATTSTTKASSKSTTTTAD